MQDFSAFLLLGNHDAPMIWVLCGGLSNKHPSVLHLNRQSCEFFERVGAISKFLQRYKSEAPILIMILLQLGNTKLFDTEATAEAQPQLAETTEASNDLSLNGCEKGVQNDLVQESEGLSWNLEIENSSAQGPEVHSNDESAEESSGEGDIVEESTGEDAGAGGESTGEVVEDTIGEGAGAGGESTGAVVEESTGEGAGAGSDMTYGYDGDKADEQTGGSSTGAEVDCFGGDNSSEEGIEEDSLDSPGAVEIADGSEGASASAQTDGSY